MKEWWDLRRQVSVLKNLLLQVVVIMCYREIFLERKISLGNKFHCCLILRKYPNQPPFSNYPDRISIINIKKRHSSSALMGSALV